MTTAPDAPSAAAVGFVDLAGFTALTESHGDAAAAALASDFVSSARATCTDDTRVVKALGDAVMLVAETRAGLVATVRDLADRCGRALHHPVLRAGAHYGPVVVLDGDVYGATVNTAARLAAQAAAGTLMASVTFADVLSAAGLTVRPLPPQVLRNVRQPLPVVEADLEVHPTSLLLDPVCRMRVTPGTAAASLRGADGELLWFCSRDCLDQHLRQNP